MQPPGTLRIDLTPFPLPCQQFVRHVYTVSVFDAPMMVAIAPSSVGVPGVTSAVRKVIKRACSAARIGGHTVTLMNKLILSRSVNPWMFEGCLDDGYPIGLIFSKRDYLSQINHSGLLWSVYNTYLMQGRKLMADIAWSYHQLLPDVLPSDRAPSPDESFRRGIITTRRSVPSNPQLSSGCSYTTPASLPADAALAVLELAETHIPAAFEHVRSLGTPELTDAFLRHTVADMTNIRDVYELLEYCIRLKRPAAVLTALREHSQVLAHHHWIILPLSMQL
ncbi:hypothetical protein B0H19DRAFT_1067445 [Mycena capillaripes]|nr:hypothetical protein B0H19DRAFT_1067445 [Mycena capillaripes]